MNDLENRTENNNELELAYSITQQVGKIREPNSNINISELLKFDGPVSVRIYDNKWSLYDTNALSLFKISNTYTNSEFHYDHHVAFAYAVAIAINNILFKTDEVLQYIENSSDKLPLISKENFHIYKLLETREKTALSQQLIGEYSGPFHTLYTNGGGYVFDRYGKIVLSACITPEFKELSTSHRLARAQCVSECINQYWFNNPIHWGRI